MIEFISRWSDYSQNLAKVRGLQEFLDSYPNYQKGHHILPSVNLDNSICIHLNNYIEMPKEVTEYIERMEPLQDKNDDAYLPKMDQDSLSKNNNGAQGKNVMKSKMASARSSSSRGSSSRKDRKHLN